MAKPSNEAFFWMLFSAGGVVAAMLIPVQLFCSSLRFHWGGCKRRATTLCYRWCGCLWCGFIYLFYARFRCFTGRTVFATRSMTVSK